MIDNKKLSAKSNCNSRARLQPMERRIAISRRRLTALASNMLAMLAHAIVTKSPSKMKTMAVKETTATRIRHLHASTAHTSGTARFVRDLGLDFQPGMFRRPFLLVQARGRGTAGATLLVRDDRVLRIAALRGRVNPAPAKNQSRNIPVARFLLPRSTACLAGGLRPR